MIVHREQNNTFEPSSFVSCGQKDFITMIHNKEFGRIK
jgi:hypothetical protein